MIGNIVEDFLAADCGVIIAYVVVIKFLSQEKEGMFIVIKNSLQQTSL